MTIRLSASLFLLSLFTISCNENLSVNIPLKPVDLTKDWARAAPESQGFDNVFLTFAYQKAETIGNLLSLIVIRNGYLVVEKYYNGNTVNSLNHIRSGTKSIISALTGIAIEKGFIKGTNETLLQLIPSIVDTCSPAKKAITLDNLLTMRSGFDWSEEGSTGASGYDAWASAPDQINFLLQKNLSYQPGTIFNYNSAAVHLISVILTENTHRSTLDFLNNYLFRYLGITSESWERDNRGYYNGAAGLQLRPVDIAKFGQLFLQKGNNGEQQIIPKDWVEKSTSVIVPFYGYNTGSFRDVNYGYLWWIEKGHAHYAYTAWGYGGQFIYVVPDLNLVVVTTAKFNGLGSSVWQQGSSIEDLIVNYIVRSVK